MTNSEQKTIDKLYSLLADIKKENTDFRQQIKDITESTQKQINQKHLPITLELSILSVAQASIQKAIQESMTGYNSPLIKLVQEVINKYSSDLRQIISDSFNEVIQTKEFKSAIVTGFSHKIARSIISNNDGLFDKVGNELKQDSVFKAKMALAVSNVVDECLKERKN